MAMLMCAVGVIPVVFAYRVESTWSAVLLIGLAALAFSVGTVAAFSHQVMLLEPVGYWRGAVGFLLFAIALQMMDRQSG